MQLTSAAGGAGRALRVRLGSAAALVLAAGAPVAAQAATDPSLRIEASGLFYTEAQRTTVYEPIGRITRLFADGQTLSAQFAVDVMTGASPTGANPAGRALTTTSASGSSTTVGADAVPTARFSDTRAALDLEWARPIGIATPTLGLHVSREKDYQSLGGNASLSVDLDHRLLTVTAGVGRNQDRVFPMAGVVRGLTTGTRSVADAADKQVTSGLLGLTRVLTRRWLMGVNVSHISERGYLTEPYKVVSLLDRGTGRTTGALREKRPETRARTSVLLSSAYHLPRNVLSLSYRDYRDDWQVRSHTLDGRLRMPIAEGSWFEPHARFYSQSAASFFRPGLIDGAALPEFASADQRLGRLKSLTLGATYAFRLPGQPGEWSIRGEYLGQFGAHHPKGTVGVQRDYDLSPALNVASVVVGWTLER